MGYRGRTTPPLPRPAGEDRPGSGMFTGVYDDSGRAGGLSTLRSPFRPNRTKEGAFLRPPAPLQCEARRMRSAGAAAMARSDGHRGLCHVYLLRQTSDPAHRGYSITQGSLQSSPVNICTASAENPSISCHLPSPTGEKSCDRPGRRVPWRSLSIERWGGGWRGPFPESFGEPSPRSR